MRINDSWALAVPLGTGEKIRGLRAHTILADEFNCLSYETLIETNTGIQRIGDIVENESNVKVINRYGEYEKPDRFIKTPLTDVYEIKTEYGFTFKCSANHKTLTTNGWKLSKDLCDKDRLIFHNQYKFPTEYVIENGLQIDEYVAKILGKTIISDNINKVPNYILKSSQSVIMSFIYGLTNTNLSINGISHFGKNENLAIDIQLLCLKMLDVICDRFQNKDGNWILKQCSQISSHGLVNDYKTSYGIKDISYLYVTSVSLLDKQEHLYDFYLPKTHSFYGNGFVQHNSIPPDIYETVVSGFAAVSSTPVKNVQEAAKRKILSKKGVWTADAEQKYQEKGGNQAIISGTAGYGFQHFAEYWRRYCRIIKSKGDPKKLQDLLGDEADDILTENFNWKDYSVIRIPYELIPEGFMDDRVVARAKATVHSSIFNQEYGTVFSEDSDGFFKRSLIEACVATDNKPIQLPSGEVWFDATTRGTSSRKYVYGIDPASERDNFSIIILELHEDHTRIVHCWTTTRKDFKERLKAGLTKDHDFYGFCARRIRDLMKVFPCERIALDAQGGGVAIEEALHDPDKLQPGELPIWPIIEEDKEKDTDLEAGLHILELIQFARADWVAHANHGMKKDFEDRVLIFPRFDTLTLELATADDKRQKTIFEKVNPNETFNIYDTIEDCVMEIEELKDELCTIVHTMTGTGVAQRDRWDTPEIKLKNGKKGRMRKDRYSALLMANMASRGIHRTPAPISYEFVGGFANKIEQKKEGKMYNGPEWFTDGLSDNTIYGIPH